MAMGHKTPLIAPEGDQHMSEIQEADTNEKELLGIFAQHASWTRQIEQAMLAIINANLRIVGITSPESGAGVSVVSRLLAASFGRAGRKTLLVSLSRPVTSSSNAWSPGQSKASDFITTDIHGFDVLDCAPTRQTRARFNHADQIREVFGDELKQYDMVLVDLPPINELSGDTINSVAASVACDAVVMVCAIGDTSRPDLRRAQKLLRQAGAQVLGSITNRPVDRALEEVPAWLAKALAILTGQRSLRPQK